MAFPDVCGHPKYDYSIVEIHLDQLNLSLSFLLRMKVRASFGNPYEIGVFLVALFFFAGHCFALWPLSTESLGSPSNSRGLCNSIVLLKKMDMVSDLPCCLKS